MWSHVRVEGNDPTDTHVHIVPSTNKDQSSHITPSHLSLSFTEGKDHEQYKYYSKQLDRWTYQSVNLKNVFEMATNQDSGWTEFKESILKEFESFLSRLSELEKSTTDDNERTQVWNFAITNAMSLAKAIQIRCENEPGNRLWFLETLLNSSLYKSNLLTGVKKLPSDKRLGQIKALVFDKDGTLISFDAMWGQWVRKLAASLEKHGGLPEAELYNIAGFDPVTSRCDPLGELAMGTNEGFKELILSHLNHIQDKEAFAKKAWVEMEVDATNIQPTTNLHELFTLLKSKGISVNILTGDDRINTEKTIELLGIKKYFDHVFTADDMVTPKPSPEAIWTICETLHCDPHQVIMVGDTPCDVQTGWNAGCLTSIGVLTGTGSAAELSRVTPYLLKNVVSTMAFNC